MGDMPNGTMTWKSHNFHNVPLEGYTAATCPTVIEINYNIPSGKLKDGTKFHGTNRTAFLPGSSEGVKVFSMLVEAFRRRLIFKVGTSISTGAQN